MKSIAIFNNKGGVGKTTLAFHAAYALAEMGHRTLMIDLDPQSNLTLFGLTEDQLNNIWHTEEPFIDDYESAARAVSPSGLASIAVDQRSIHYLLKPTEDGTGESITLGTPIQVHANLGIIPGRLTLHMFEERLASRWSDSFRGDPLALRSINRIRRICEEYAAARDYKFVIIDTSPSLGVLNKVIISTVDGFVVPCMPDMFSLYGIRNIGRALAAWQRDFTTLLSLLSDAKRSGFPAKFVQFLGFTIYKAKKYTTDNNPWNLATAHYGFAQQIPETIRRFIPQDTYKHLSHELLFQPIGGTAVMHDHATMAALAPKYKRPIWLVPGAQLDEEDRTTVPGNRRRFEDTRQGYHDFARDLLVRLETLG